MRLAFVNTSLHLGGAETVARQLHEGCRATGHPSRLYVAAGKTFPRGEGVVPLYPRLLSRLYHSRFHPWVERFFPQHRWTDRAFRRLAQASADVIHIHNFHGDYATIQSLAWLAARKPVIWTFHGFWGITGGCDHPQSCDRYQAQCGDCPKVGSFPIGPVDRTREQLRLKLDCLKPAPLTIIGPSKHLVEKVRTSQVGRAWTVAHIPNAIELTLFRHERKHDAVFRARHGVAPDEVCILLVNRNYRDPGKGFAAAARALQTAPPEKARVLVAGHESPWALAQIPLAGVDKGFVASRRELAELYEVADIFLFASPMENFPCVILEAMAAQCCIVATPTAGVLEQVEHEKTALLSPAMTGVGLGATLRRAMDDAGLRHQLGAQARAQVEREYSLDVMVRRHLELYAQLITERNQTHSPPVN